MVFSSLSHAFSHLEVLVLHSIPGLPSIDDLSGVAVEQTWGSLGSKNVLHGSNPKVCKINFEESKNEKSKSCTLGIVGHPIFDTNTMQTVYRLYRLYMIVQIIHCWDNTDAK